MEWWQEKTRKNKLHNFYGENTIVSFESGIVVEMCHMRMI